MGSHCGVGAPPIFRTYFSGEWDVHWGYLAFDPWRISVCDLDFFFFLGGGAQNGCCFPLVFLGCFCEFTFDVPVGCRSRARSAMAEAH